MGNCNLCKGKLFSDGTSTCVKVQVGVEEEKGPVRTRRERGEGGGGGLFTHKF